MLERSLDNFDLQILLDSMPQGVYVTDTERRIVYWSKSAERITGWKPSEIMGLGCFDNTLCHVDKDGRRLCGEEFCPLHRSIVTGQPSTVPVIVFAQHRNGSRVPMRVSVAPIHDKAGTLVGGIEVFQDLSEEFNDMRRGRRIQAASMVNDAVNDKRLSVQVHYAPHDIIGGDFYAISRLDDESYGFVLADVSGHGLSAALYTMHLASLWADNRHLIRRPVEYARVVSTRLEALLHDDGSFASAVCGVVNIPARTIDLTSAGGPGPLLYSRDGQYQVIDIFGNPLGFIGSDDFGERHEASAFAGG